MYQEQGQGTTRIFISVIATLRMYENSGNCDMKEMREKGHKALMNTLQIDGNIYMAERLKYMRSQQIMPKWVE